MSCTVSHVKHAKQRLIVDTLYKPQNGHISCLWYEKFWKFKQYLAELKLSKYLIFILRWPCPQTVFILSWFIANPSGTLPRNTRITYLINALEPRLNDHHFEVTFLNSLCCRLHDDVIKWKHFTQSPSSPLWRHCNGYRFHWSLLLRVLRISQSWFR